MLHVTKSFLPDLKEYVAYLEKIWSSNHLTNDGPLLLELEKKLAEFLEVEHLIFTGNGTIALQLALKAYNITGDVITTPFSYCATTNSLLWENCNPIFADIDPVSLTVESSQIASKLTSSTKAILTTHVYGNAGDLELQEELARYAGIALIYDGAHAFGVNYKGNSIFSYGDITTCSFHATKIFHTVEGGAVIVKDAKIANKVRELRSFGHKGDVYLSAGINGKNSEFHAAMGLVNLTHFEEIKSHRQHACELYDSKLCNQLQRIQWNADLKRNYSYYPIVLASENDLNQIVENLINENVTPRRYFYPSLNTLPFVNAPSCPVSEDISKRILCLPLSATISNEEIIKVVDIINSYYS
ncbi:DegT/DnrJ/EryC1/StrS family aminotransferase [Aquirufa sp. OSTEICH-129V]|uniref:DegT/DnrJ/EryC1/StrS family aminotransferase n=1 Tax=Aquirufa avitistagni TaxID=3104728 RepID=A0ABW6DA25_9BACT